MTHIHRSALVPFSAEAMYNLVNDVDCYPDFIPGCDQSRVLEHTDTLMKASLLVAKAGIKQWFTTENTLIKNRSITLLLLDGPFKSLEGTWQFIPLDDSACKIEFDLRFEFDNKLAKMAFSKIFTSLTSNMVNAFTRRAREVYQ